MTARMRLHRLTRHQGIQYGWPFRRFKIEPGFVRNQTTQKDGKLLATFTGIERRDAGLFIPSKIFQRLHRGPRDFTDLGPASSDNERRQWCHRVR